MAKASNTKSSLAMSILSMALCAVMLIGSTYAWFSDSAKTGTTTITAGNLDVDIVDEKGDSLQDQPLFEIPADFLWEPGAMFISKRFNVKNNGTVALWYSLTVNAENAGEGDNNLLDVVKMKVANAKKLDVPEKGADQAARKAYWDSITAEVEATEGTLEPKESSDELVAVLYWEPTLSTEDGNKDNLYNNPDETLSATFTVSVFATQTTSESDSFGNQYDADAKFKGGVIEPDEGATGETLEDTIIDVVGGDKNEVKEVIYGTWAEYGTAIGGSFTDGEKVNEAGTIRAFNDEGTVYMLTEQADTGIAAPQDFSFGLSSLPNLTTADLSGLDFSSTTNIENLFIGCTGLTDVDLNGVDFSKIESASGMFAGCSSLESVDLSEVNFEVVTDVSNMFQNCKKLTEVDLGEADFSHVTNLYWLFGGCSTIETIDLSGVTTSNELTTMHYMFAKCTALKEVTFGEGFDTSNVKDFRCMFQQCINLATIDLSNFDAPSEELTVAKLQNMFSECTNLTTIYASDAFDLSKVLENGEGANIFYKCTKLVGGAGTKYISWSDGPMSTRAHIDGGTNNPGYFTVKEG